MAWYNNSMKISLKKFSINPKGYMRRAPVIITVNDRPTYAIIPYVTYKTKWIEGNMPDLHQNTFTQHIERFKQKRWWKILF